MGVFAFLLHEVSDGQHAVSCFPFTVYFFVALVAFRSTLIVAFPTEVARCARVVISGFCFRALLLQVKPTLTKLQDLIQKQSLALSERHVERWSRPRTDVQPRTQDHWYAVDTNSPEHEILRILHTNVFVN